MELLPWQMENYIFFGILILNVQWPAGDEVGAQCSSRFWARVFNFVLKHQEIREGLKVLVSLHKLVCASGLEEKFGVAEFQFCW